MHKNKDVVARIIQDQTVLVPISYSPDGLYAFHLDEVGSFLWRHMDESMDVQILAEKLAEEFDVDANTAKLDVQQFLTDLQTSKILL